MYHTQNKSFLTNYQGQIFAYFVFLIFFIKITYTQNRLIFSMLNKALGGRVN